MYRVILSKPAQKDVERLPHELWERILKCLRDLKEDPRPYGSLKLKGDKAYRLRSGDYRILFDIDDKRREVNILRVLHRSDAFRNK